MKWDDIKKVWRLLKNTDITEFQYEKDGEKIKIKRNGIHAAPNVSAVQKESLSNSHKKVDDQVPSETDNQRLFTVTSPIVGTFYNSPSPEDPPFIEVGSEIKKGQVLCIIEAMKLMNEIESEVDGTVMRILVENTQPVEYGEPLFLIDPK